MPNESFFQPSFRGQTVDELRREMQFSWQQMVGRLDELAGKRGTPAFFADIDTQGHRITNVSLPGADTDPELSGLSLGRSAFGEEWDAENQPIQNLPSGRGLSDSVNLDQVLRLVDDALLALLPAGVILLWSGTVASVPEGWLLCDGSLGTPNLTDRFVVGAGSTHNPGDTGGADTVDLSHTHDVGTYVNAAEAAHTHGPGSLGTDSDATVPTGTTTVDITLAGATDTVASDAHTHAHTHSVTTGTTAAGSSHTHTITGASAIAGSATQENRPAFYALAYIMKSV